MKSSLIFDISSLMDKGTGTRELFSFDSKEVLEGLDLTSNISGKLEIMRIEDGVNARATNVKVSARLNCDKCLEPYDQKVQFKATERQFWMDKPEKIEDPHDIYLIDKKELTIDVSEMLRQEIILHFPVISVCSKGCKGLCPICGKNKNREECHCVHTPALTEKPLAALKELLK